MNLFYSVVFGFAVGLILAIITWTIIIYLRVRAYRKKIRETLGALKSTDAENKAWDGVSQRLRQVLSIVDKQQKMASQIETPSSNALHSRYKNDLLRELQQLEEEKIAILQSILSDGYDPTLAFVDERGQKVTIALSRYMQLHNVPLKPSTLPTTVPAPFKRVGKFIVYKGGKDDGGTVH